MILVIFPSKVENPFPLKLKKGELSLFKENIHLLYTGMGKEGSCTLSKVLKTAKFISVVVVFGGAALIKNGNIGQIYECNQIFSTDGEKIHEYEALSGSKTAGITSGDFIFQKNSNTSFRQKNIESSRLNKHQPL